MRPPLLDDPIHHCLNGGTYTQSVLPGQATTVGRPVTVALALASRRRTSHDSTIGALARPAGQGTTADIYGAGTPSSSAWRPTGRDTRRRHPGAGSDIFGTARPQTSRYDPAPRCHAGAHAVRRAVRSLGRSGRADENDARKAAMPLATAIFAPVYPTTTPRCAGRPI